MFIRSPKASTNKHQREIIMCNSMFPSKLRLSTFLCLIMALAMVQASLAGFTPREYVAAHNSARAEVGVGPVKWDARVAAYARNYTNTLIDSCQLVHSSSPYGENLFWGWRGDYGAAEVVAYWVSEKQYYDRGSDTCAEGQECGHYLAIVWKDVTSIGCARVVCSNGDNVIVSCNYKTPTMPYVGQ